jgi:Flp pilus assembly protein TadD
MRRRMRRWGWLLAGLMAAPAGCVGPLRPDAADPLGQPAAASAPTAGALPAEQGVVACLAVGQTEEKNGNDAAALAQYEKAVALDPHCLAAVRRLAVLYDKKCDFSKADAAYKQAAQAQPRDAELFNDWGYSYYLRNNWDEAAAKLRRALEIDPHNARAHCNLGLVLGAQKKYHEALQAFLDAGLSEAEAHSDLAFVYLTKGDLAEARRECEYARMKDPFCAKAQEMLTRLDAPPKGSGGEKASGGDAAVQPAGFHPPAPKPKGEPGGDPVLYRSPNGVGWAPVPPHAAGPAPEGDEPAADPGTPGTGKFE